MDSFNDTMFVVILNSLCHFQNLEESKDTSFIKIHLTVWGTATAKRTRISQKYYLKKFLLPNFSLGKKISAFSNF